MNRKPLPSEIEEQKDVWICETDLKITQPEQIPFLNFFPLRKKIIPRILCDKCGKVKKIIFPSIFIKGWDCECKK